MESQPPYARSKPHPRTKYGVYARRGLVEKMGRGLRSGFRDKE